MHPEKDRLALVGRGEPFERGSKCQFEFVSSTLRILFQTRRAKMNGGNSAAAQSYGRAADSRSLQNEKNGTRSPVPLLK
jgi:hypothetical protein